MFKIELDFPYLANKHRFGHFISSPCVIFSYINFERSCRPIQPFEINGYTSIDSVLLLPLNLIKNYICESVT